MNGQACLADAPATPLLETHEVSKAYTRGRWQSNSGSVAALNNLNLTLFRGSTLALVGRSGAGKSTVARCLALLEKPDSGEIRFQNANTRNLSSGELKRARRCIQLVWQHSALALNPRFRAVDIVAEPLRVQQSGSRGQQRERALAMMSKLGLPDSMADRMPLQLSGGQKQRVAIARALVTNPAVLIFDEALAGLDLPLQAEVTKLLAELKISLSLSFIFISHDLRMAAALADEIAVIHEGRIVEAGRVSDVFSSPKHSATRELIESIPSMPIPDDRLGALE
jgi:ABC-type glutathione transport system ATPase component